MNNSYRRSADRERALKNQFEKQGWYATRSAGSHGVADVVLIRPAEQCAHPAHYQVRFIQVKTSQRYKEAGIEHRIEKMPFGLSNVEYWVYPSKPTSKRTKGGES